MAVWELTPFKKFGQLTFGDTRELVRTQLGPPFRTFRKSAKSVNDTDDYLSVGLHLYYDSNDRLNFIETLGSSCGPVYVAGVPAFAGTMNIFMAGLAAKGFLATPGPSGCFFPDLGVAVYAPDKSRIESIGVFDSAEFATYLELQSTIAEKQRLREERRKMFGPPHNPFK